MSDLLLEGCKTRPLGSYLKALGVLRLVGEQLDEDATGRWDDDTFVLGTSHSAKRLKEFFLSEYSPTPIVSPWNGRSGFNTDRNRRSEVLLGYIETSTDERLDKLRAAIGAGRVVYERATKESWEKDRWVQACRATFPDEAVRWLDAAAVLTEEGASYPFLLGTGGNLGSMDLSNNFMDRLGDALGIPLGSTVPEESLRNQWLSSSIFAMYSPALKSAAPGQFDPGGKARELVNPWDFVLVLEGSLLFASGAARRMGPGGARTAAMPFMVGFSPVGFPGGTEGEGSRGELWAPLWRSPVTHAEIARLIGEGRSSWGRRQARSGLDFARAAASLGVDRGVDSFERYAFLERHGQDMIALPAGTIAVRSRPEVPLLSQLGRWVDSVRRVREVPNGVTAALRRVDAEQFRVATGGGVKAFQGVLVAAAGLESMVAHSATLKDQVRAPAPRLAAEQWLPLLDDGSREFRIAASLASQGDGLPKGSLDDHERTASSLPLLLRPVTFSKERRLEWSGRPVRVPGLGVVGLVEVLSSALRLRVRDAITKTRRIPGLAEEGQVGVEPAFDYALPALVEDIAAFVMGETDDGRISDLLRGLLLLEWRGPRPEMRWPRSHLAVPPPPAWVLTAPFFARRSHGETGPALRAGASWPQQLIAGRVGDVLDDALRRLRIARVDPALSSPHVMAAGVDGQRLAAGLLVPISPGSREALMHRISPSEPVAARD